MKKFIYLFIGLLGYLLITQTTIANSLSLSLDPSIIEITVIPPSNPTANLTIKNKSDNQVVLKIQLRPFKAKLENARPPATLPRLQTPNIGGQVAGEVGRGELEYLNLQDSFIAKNVRILDGGVPVEDITLGPKQQKNLTLNVNIPQDTNVAARPPATLPNHANNKTESVAGEVGRDYYFSIIFVSQSIASPTSTSSSNRLGIASNVLLSVGKKEMPDAILEEFSSGLFYESGPVPFTIRLKNKGIHFIKPKGQVIIKNMFGQSIGKLDLMSVNILSDSTRAIPNALWKEDFLLGFYTATLNIALSGEGPSFTKSIRFFAFPFQGLIVIVIVLISTIIIVNRVRFRIPRRDALGKR